MQITFEPEGKTVVILPEQTLLEAAQKGGVPIVATCGGRGRCQSCRIQLLEGALTPPTEQETAVLSEQSLQDGFRLACQTHALTDGKVRLLPPISETAFQILSQTERLEYALNPDVSKHHLVFPETSVEQQSSDVEELQKNLGGQPLAIDLPTLQSLPAAIIQASRDVTAVVWDRHLIAVEPGNTTAQLYGIAVDIGTTTVVGYLLDLLTGQELAVAAELNAQTRYGGDVMSRITLAQQDAAGLQQLQQAILETVNTIIETLCRQAAIDSRQIYEITVVGNTCMHHLFLHIPPVHLGVAPYRAVIRRRYAVTASELGLHACPQARVVMLPLIAGFVGADTVGVILAAGMHKSGDLKLAVDIGTNGEIVLGTGDRLLACSTAAGPAFEGAQITHGMRGAVGAIDRVVIDDDVHLHVLGDVPALGICGSGLVDAIAQMLNAGLIKANGRLLSRHELAQHGEIPPQLQARLLEENRMRKFILAHGDQTEHGAPIVITQQDIRHVQLAKGAIFAGIGMVMDALQIHKEDLTEFLLAGAFGNYLDKVSAVRIGLIPHLPLKKIRSVGNAAGLGAQLALLSGEAKQEADQIAATTEHLALTNNPAFHLAFAEAMTFPEH